MKKLLILAIFCILVVFCACAKSNKKTKAENTDNNQSNSLETVNPDLAKLNNVLLSMSNRFKENFSNGDPNEFLKELYEVLEEEKAFTTDDLSLFYFIDKKHSVGSDYVPKNLINLKANQYYNVNRNNLYLRSDVEKALQEMAQAARKDGITLLVSSTYRSYEYQKSVFARWVSIDGLEEAERESAREGTSQHQLGTAIDFGSINDSFISTSQGKWLNENAYKYGWSLSFPDGYEDVTGFRWECWHFRYIGKKACAFQKKRFNDVQQFMIEFIDAWRKMD